MWPDLSSTPVAKSSPSRSIRPLPQMPTRRGVVDRAKRRLAGVGVDPDVFDGAGARPHAVPHAAALEGGAGRAGAGDQPVLGAQHDLAVGADVDEQREPVGGVEPGADHAGGDVAADVAAHRRHDVHARLRVRAQAELVGGELGRHA